MKAQFCRVYLLITLKAVRKAIFTGLLNFTGGVVETSTNFTHRIRHQQRCLPTTPKSDIWFERNFATGISLIPTIYITVRPVSWVQAEPHWLLCIQHQTEHLFVFIQGEKINKYISSNIFLFKILIFLWQMLSHNKLLIT